MYSLLGWHLVYGIVHQRKKFMSTIFSAEKSSQTIEGKATAPASIAVADGCIVWCCSGKCNKGKTNNYLWFCSLNATSAVVLLMTSGKYSHSQASLLKCQIVLSVRGWGCHRQGSCKHLLLIFHTRWKPNCEMKAKKEGMWSLNLPCKSLICRPTLRWNRESKGSLILPVSEACGTASAQH